MAASIETLEREDGNGTEVDAEMNPGDGPRLGKDQLVKRLKIGLVGSIILNAIIWANLSTLLKNHVVREMPPATFKRIYLAPPPKPKPTPPPPKPKPTPPPPPIQQKVVPVQKQPTPQPQQHNHVMTSAVPGPSSGSALSGGTAPVGKPIESQQPTVVATPVPSPIPQPSPIPTPIPTPKPIPSPLPTPQSGPTQDAQATSQPYPDIPDDLKNDDYKSYVRVKVTIEADGSTGDVALVSSSGNEDIDQRVIDALKRWRWKPALKNGTPIESTQRFRFDFEVN